MLHLVFRGRATHKQSVLWFERTTCDALVQNHEYFLTWSQRNLSGPKPVPQGQSVRQVVAEIAGREGDKPRFYFLVRGIAPEETLFSGYTNEPQSSTLSILPGDLLIIDPRPKHPLFGAMNTSADNL